jgi:hypothetical protein
MKTRSKTPKPVVEVKKSIEKPKKVVEKRGKQVKQNIVEEEEVVETKIIKKPKTVKHSQYQASRIQRGKTQRMFLLSVKRELATWDANIVIWRCEVQGVSLNSFSILEIDIKSLFQTVYHVVAQITIDKESHVNIFTL